MAISGASALCTFGVVARAALSETSVLVLGTDCVTSKSCEVSRRFGKWSMTMDRFGCGRQELEGHQGTIMVLSDDDTLAKLCEFVGSGRFHFLPT